MSQIPFNHHAFYRAASPSPSVTLDRFTTRVKGLLKRYQGQSIPIFRLKNALYLNTSVYSASLTDETKPRQTEAEALEIANRKYADTTLRVTGFVEYLGCQSRCLISCSEHGDTAKWSKPWQPKLFRMMFEDFICPKCAGRYRYSDQERITELNQMLDQRGTGLSVRALLRVKGKPTRCLMHCQEHGNGEDWGTPWQPTIGDLQNKGCPKCANCYRYSEQEAMTRVQGALDQFQPHLRIRGFVKYKGKNSRCLIYCQYHGDGDSWAPPWLPDMSAMLRGSGCPKCSKNYRYTVEERVKQLNDKLTDKPWSVLSIDGTCSTARCDMYCHIHGHGSKWGNPWRPTVNDVNHSYGCPKCQGRYCKTAEEALNSVNQILADAGFYHRVIRFCGKYHGKESLCNICCSMHGDASKWAVPWHPRLHDLMMKNINCLKCSGQYQPSESEARKAINALIAVRHISVLGFERYLASEGVDKSRCIMQCAVHGTGDDYAKPWRPMLRDLKRGSGCPLCAADGRELQRCLANPKQYAYPRYLYYLTFRHSASDKFFFKIGIRQERHLYSRYSLPKIKAAGLDVDAEWLAFYPNVTCLLIEYWLLHTHADLREYQPLMRRSGLEGATECFNSDITEGTNMESLVLRTLDAIPELLDDFPEQAVNKSKLLKQIEPLTNQVRTSLLSKISEDD